MATLTCPSCGAPFQPGDLICLECGANLARARAVRKHPPTREEPKRPPPAQQPPPQEPARPVQHRQQPRRDTPPIPPDSPVPPPPPLRPLGGSASPPIPARREETLVPPEERPPPASSHSIEESTAFMCPHCEAVITDPHATICVQCLRPLRPPPVLRLAFPAGELKIQVGQRLVLGRDASQSPVAATFTQYDNVSRRHAIVSLDPTGQPLVRDEGSKNGTYVNGERIPTGVDVPLRDGDSLRLAADVTGAVRLS